MAMPDRIWATPIDQDFDGGMYCDAVIRKAPNVDALCYVRADIADPQAEEIARMRAALKLAANRLHKCSIDYDTGSREFYEVGEWAEAARAALAKTKGGE